METADVTVYVAEVEDAIWDGHRKPLRRITARIAFTPHWLRAGG